MIRREFLGMTAVLALCGCNTVDSGIGITEITVQNLSTKDFEIVVSVDSVDTNYYQDTIQIEGAITHDGELRAQVETLDVSLDRGEYEITATNGDSTASWSTTELPGGSTIRVEIDIERDGLPVIEYAAV